MILNNANRTLSFLSNNMGCVCSGPVIRSRRKESDQSVSHAVSAVEPVHKSLFERVVAAPGRQALKVARFVQLAVKIAGQGPKILGGGLLTLTSLRMLFNALLSLSVVSGGVGVMFLGSGLWLAYSAYAAVVKKEGELAKKIADAQASVETIKGLQTAALDNADKIEEGVRLAQEKTQKLKVMIEQVGNLAESEKMDLDIDLERLQLIVENLLKLEKEAGCAFVKRKTILERIQLAKLISSAKNVDVDSVESLVALIKSFEKDFQEAETLNQVCVFNLAKTAQVYQEALSIAINAIRKASEGFEDIIEAKETLASNSDMTQSTMLWIEIGALKANLEAAQEQTRKLEKDLEEARKMANDGLHWGQVLAGLTMTSLASGLGTVPAVALGAGATLAAGRANSALNLLEKALKAPAVEGPVKPAAEGPNGAVVVFDRHSSGMFGRFKGRGSRTVGEVRFSLGSASYAYRFNLKDENPIAVQDLKAISDAMIERLGLGHLDVNDCGVLIKWLESVVIDRSRGLSSSEGSDSDNEETHVGLIKKIDLQLVKNKIREMLPSVSGAVSSAATSFDEDPQD